MFKIVSHWEVFVLDVNLSLVQLVEHGPFDLCRVASREEVFLICAKSALAVLALQTQLESEANLLVFHMKLTRVVCFRQIHEDLHSG